MSWDASRGRGLREGCGPVSRGTEGKERGGSALLEHGLAALPTRAPGHSTGGEAELPSSPMQESTQTSRAKAQQRNWAASRADIQKAKFSSEFLLLCY